MSVAGIVGWPVAHSRSPQMHGAAIAALGLDATYVRFPVRPGELEAALAGIRALGICGVNVTVPHKQSVVPLLDRVDERARRIGAVNTLWREGDALVGTNTDAPGLVRSLEEAGVDAKVPALVLGAGGAARAAVVGLADAGASIRVAARRPESAAAMLRETGVDGAVVALDDAGAYAQTELLVQATSATMGEGSEKFAVSLPLASLPPSAAVVDLVYAPLETTVLRIARARRLRCVDGLGMLLWQGALAFERFYGVAPPIDAMRAALASD